MSGEEASKSKEVLDAMSGVPLIVQYPSGEAYQFDPTIDSAIFGCTHIQTGVIQIMPEEEASKTRMFWMQCQVLLPYISIPVTSYIKWTQRLILFLLHSFSYKI